MAPVTTLGPTLAEKIRNGGITHRTASSPTQAGQALGCPTKAAGAIVAEAAAADRRQDAPRRASSTKQPVRIAARVVESSLGATGDGGGGDVPHMDGRRLAASGRVSRGKGGQASG